MRKVEFMECIEHRPAHLGNVALDQRPELRADLRAVVQLVGEGAQCNDGEWERELGLAVDALGWMQQSADDGAEKVTEAT